MEPNERKKPGRKPLIGRERLSIKISAETYRHVMSQCGEISPSAFIQSLIERDIKSR